MIYKVNDIEVPSSNPFEHDTLGRRELVEFLSSFIRRLSGPFVLALDSPWGSGKTTLVRMMMECLRGDDLQCLYFNAWKFDYTDPFVALVSLINDIEVGEDESTQSFKEGMESVKKVAGAVAKRALMSGVKIATYGILDLETPIEGALADASKESVADIFDLFKRNNDQLQNFREELERTIRLLPENKDGKKRTLVIFIDELDRCRPSFTIELLERIKHIFDIKNIVFVLSIDKSQIEASTVAVYGKDINSREYLRRFIDLDYRIPAPVTDEFIRNLITKRFNLSPLFAERVRLGGSDLQYDEEHFIAYFSKLARALGLSLRACERCITRFCVVLDQTPENHYIDSIPVALLIVLKSNMPELFDEMLSGVAGPDAVINQISKLPNGHELVTSREGLVLFSYLLLMDTNQQRSRRLEGELKGGTGAISTIWDKSSVGMILEIKNQLSCGRRSINFTNVARKIDLATRIH